MKLSIIIPVYNEERTIKEVLEKISKVNLDKEIIVINDGSIDGTVAILTAERGRNACISTVFNSPTNIGKGAAIRRGIGYVKGDIVLIQDADLELDPNEYYDLINPILEGKADVVYGSRFLKKLYNAPILTVAANKFLTLLTNILYKINLTDMETAYKAFRTEVIKRISLKSLGFEFEPEVTAKLSRSGYKIYEVPVSYQPRSVKEGKKIGWMDGLKAIYYLFKYRFTDIDEIQG